MKRLLVVIAAALMLCSGMRSDMSVPTVKVSSVFEDGGFIPAKYTCDGEDVNPPLRMSNLSENAKSLAIVVEDPDAPGGVFTHWIAWNIPPVGEIPEGIPKEAKLSEPLKIVQGKNDFGRIGYNGPCPPGGVHHYYFKVYVLDTELKLKPGATKEELLKAMKGHVIQYGELVGLYSRR